MWDFQTRFHIILLLAMITLVLAAMFVAKPDAAVKMDAMPGIDFLALNPEWE